MKAQLYAVRKGNVWEWRLTIHPETDCQYWFEQYAADAGLVMFEPFISLGQGVRLREKLQMQLHREGLNAVEGSDDGRILGRIRQLAEECGILNSEALELRRVHYEQWMQGRCKGFTWHADVYAKLVKACSGRSLLVEELQQLVLAAGLELGAEDDWQPYVQLAHLNGDVEIMNGLNVLERRDWRRWFRPVTGYSCKRCGSGTERMFWSACLHCGHACPYCEECLTMGRVRMCSLLVVGRSGDTSISDRGYGDEVGDGIHEVESDLQTYIEPWGLSEAQERASMEGLRFIIRPEVGGGGKRGGRKEGGIRKQPDPRRFLIWAVTGAGKTEMIFPFIHLTIARGGRVLIATPRKDVVLELQPRIERAFADYSVVTLYGGSEQRWEQGQITIATTHQLLRFQEAFDLVIIDEIDAFPYHNNPMLGYAAAKVCKPSGTNILLSATPSRAIRKAAERGRLPHVRVPVRFHKHPLPVPQLISVPTLRKSLKVQTLPQSLLSRFKVSVERGAQVFVFVPNIQLVEPTVALLRCKLRMDKQQAAVRIEGTSSKDLSRTEKVQLFRNREIRVLVTTTILERGVTVPQSDVFIMDADSKIFDEAALVQMAGRAGRSKDDPAGKVYLAAAEITLSQKEAVRQIRTMNRIARKHGFLLRGK
ncbi:DEAD/DEAH box helicase [Paenibacillus sp. SI8]|uniref:DEAD/DEAH box helicase n=1 Tax=unclassified Paenibacillus TaxID=185978 RepID=UPI0034659321